MGEALLYIAILVVIVPVWLTVRAKRAGIKNKRSDFAARHGFAFSEQKKASDLPDTLGLTVFFNLTARHRLVNAM